MHGIGVLKDIGNELPQGSFRYNHRRHQPKELIPSVTGDDLEEIGTCMHDKELLDNRRDGECEAEMISPDGVSQ